MGTQDFDYRAGELCCEQVPVASIAKDVGTPCYIYSKHRILKNCRHFQASLSGLNALVCYSVKANSNLAVLRLLQQEGCGFDIVSGGELHRVLRAGADPRMVVFSGVGKSPLELEMALDGSLLSINVESLEELQTLGVLAARKGVRTDICLRINPDVDVLTHPYIATGLRQHKFGIDMDRVPELIGALQAHPRLQLIGLGFHIGSQIMDVQPFLDAFLKTKQLADGFRSSGFPIEILDLGGGVGIPYRGEEPADLARYSAFLKEQCGPYRLLFEPGRLIVGDAGILLNQVLHRKVNHGKSFVIVDGAMNDLMRPSLYQAHHEILAVRRREETVIADVVGPICESGDFFARDRQLPDFRQGDLLAVMNAGAYGFVLSSNYNSRPRAPEVLVDGDRFQVVRRRETIEDLTRGESY
jgi:diaminopimelate decarboxylase